MAVAAAVGGLVVPSAATAATPQCADLLLVFARGSGQNPDSNEQGNFFSELRKLTPAGLGIQEYRLGQQGTYIRKHGPGKRVKHAYPAASVMPSAGTVAAGLGGGVIGAAGQKAAEYNDSVIEGRLELIDVLNDRVVDCPREEWIIGGYSQGAQVVGDAVAAIKPPARDRVAFVALFGDPMLLVHDDADCSTYGWWLRGSAECGNKGIIARVADRRPYLPKSLRGRAGSWCDRDDGMCAAGVFHAFDGAHFKYSDVAIPDAALEALSSLRRRLPGRFEIVNPPAARGGAGLDVMIIFDTTGSMADEIVDARADARRLADQVLTVPNGRIGLVQFRDHPEEGDEFAARMELDLSSDFAAFSAALDRLEATGGGDIPEAQYSGMMTAFNGASWRFGATKIAVVITDAPGKDPEPVTGYTSAGVVKRALEIDPVGVYGIDVCGCETTSGFLQPIAAGSGGEVLAADGDVSSAVVRALTRAGARPVVRVPATYRAAPGRPVTLSAEGSFDPDSNVASFRWDLDGNGEFEVATTTPFVTTTYAAPGQLLVGVAAVADDGGIGTAITTVTVARGGVASLRPRPVRAVKAKLVKARSLRLTWKRARGGPAPEGYLILDPKKRFVIAKVNGPRPRPITINKLKPRSRPRFYVVAVTRAGTSKPVRSKAVRIPPKQRHAGGGR